MMTETAMEQSSATAIIDDSESSTAITTTHVANGVENTEEGPTLPQVPPDKIQELLEPVPKEIDLLMSCSKAKMPVSIIMSRKSDLMAFTLPEKYGYACLGFFEVANISTTHDVSSCNHI